MRVRFGRLVDEFLCMMQDLEFPFSLYAGWSLKTEMDASFFALPELWCIHSFLGLDAHDSRFCGSIRHSVAHAFRINQSYVGQTYWRYVYM